MSKQKLYMFHKFTSLLFRNYVKMSEKSNQVLVISGPSGAGKSSLIKQIVHDYPKKFGFCTSHTSRQPRVGEINGVHYHFTESKTLKKFINQGEFVEHTIYNGNIYGTSKKALLKVIEEGKVCLLDIDVEGVKQIRNTEFNPTLVFVKPPDMTELKNRLKTRSTETPRSLEARIECAKSEMEYGNIPDNFHKVIINDDLQKAYGDLKNFITEEMNINLN